MNAVRFILFYFFIPMTGTLFIDQSYSFQFFECVVIGLCVCVCVMSVDTSLVGCHGVGIGGLHDGSYIIF